MIVSSSCSSDRTTNNNPLLEESWDTPYGIAPFDRIKAQDYMPALELAIEEQNRIVSDIIADTMDLTFDSVILALDNSDIKIADIFNIFTMVEASASTKELSAVNSLLMPRLSVQRDNILLNDSLFVRVKNIYDRRSELNLNGDQLRLTQKIYDDFVRGGALLSEESKQRLAAINESIAQLRVRFSQNLLKETNSFELILDRSQISGLPNAVRNMAAAEALSRGMEGKWIVTLQSSSMIPFLTHSDNRVLRDSIYKAHINRGRNGNEYDNRQIVEDVTKLRLERAKLLGYDNHAEYVTSKQMAGSAAAAYRLLDKIWTPALDLAKKELERMEQIFRKNQKYKKVEFEPWDWRYYNEHVRDADFKLKSEALSLYFPVEGVRNGALVLANRLYGITFRPIITPQYADLCNTYEVIDIDGKALGLLHMDLYTRPTKGQGAWCGFLREQRYENAERVLPIVSISCNFAQAKSGKTLLTMEEVETLFHEFGHALHFLFQDVKYRGLSEVEGDFVELPSQIMENWAFEPEMLRLYALHHSSGEVIGEQLITKIRRSRVLNQGFMTLEVAASALLDLDLHTLTDIDTLDCELFEKESLRDDRYLIPQIDPRYYLPYFSHLFTFDYASGYYFYLWAEVMDKDIFQRFKSSGDLFNRSLAQKFRHDILERGGSEDGVVMYRNFMGADPAVEPLLIARGLMEPPKIEEDKLPEIEEQAPQTEEQADNNNIEEDEKTK